MQCIEDEKLTGFILKDILTRNFTFENIKKALEKTMSGLSNIDVSRAMSIHLLPDEVEKEKKETDDERKKRIGFPDNDIWMLLSG